MFSDSPSFAERETARLSRPRAESRTRIAVVADTHASEQAATYLRRAVEDINDRDVDAVLHAGDVSGDGHPREFDLFDDVVAALEPPLHVIPGNHDPPKSFNDHPTLPFGEFRERYAPPSGYPFVERVGGIDLIGINSAGTDEFLADTHDGEIPASTVEWLDAALAEASTPVVLVHHNLPAMMAQYERYRDAVSPDHDGSPPVHRSPEPFVDVLADHEVPLVLTGHMHIPSLARTRGVPELMAPSTQEFPHGYLLLTVGPDGTAVRTVSLATHDELRDAYEARVKRRETAAVLARMAAVRLASFPVDDRA